ncbi:hypothetical protein PM082_020204 [Marasmius tenuissimus]|nr:hypothetical protein PM082_020204 [Marasmius tenuissimus]
MGESNEQAHPQNSEGGIQDHSPGFWRSFLIIAACTLTMISNSVNNTSVSIALPSIERGLHMGPADLQWVVSGYALSSGCLLLLFGRLADLHGRKKAFLAGSMWLVAFTLSCGFAKDRQTLNVLRGMQGAGAAATIPAAIGILAHSFPPHGKTRAIAFASFGAGAPVGAAFGTAVGGVLTQFTSTRWRSTFYFSAALTFASAVLGALAFEKDKPSTETDKRVDWIGASLVTTGLILVVFVLSQGEVAPGRWKTPYIVVFLILGLVLLAMFIYWEHRLETLRKYNKTSWLPTPPPIMPLSLWARAKGRVAVVMCIACCLWASFLGWNYWILLYYQDLARLSALATVVRLIPMFVTGILCNVFVALVVGRLPLVYLMGFGTTVTSVASLLFALIQPEAPYWAYGFPAAILSVFGADFVFTAGTMFIAKISLPHEQSVAGGVLQCMMQLGTSLGITVSTVVFDHVRIRVYHEPPPRPGHGPPKSAPLGAYHAAMWTTFAFGAVASLLAIVFLRGVGVVGQRADRRQSGDTEAKTSSDPQPSELRREADSEKLPKQDRLQKP